MNIYRKSLLSGASETHGTAVIVDVFRAFTCASILLDFGVERLLLEENPENALKLKRESGYIALGEIGGVMVEGFDFGNSPTEITSAGKEFFTGKKIVQRTSAGVRGIFAAVQNCDHVYAVAYTTADALAKHLRKENHPEIYIVAMGQDGKTKVPEDEHCAALIRHLLDPSVSYDHISALQEILSHESALKFLRGDKSHYPPSDVTWCLQRDVFLFTMKVSLTSEGIELKKT